MSDIRYDYNDPDPQAVQAFDDLWMSNRPWILNYLGRQKLGKSLFLSWLIENRCQVKSYPYSLISFSTYTSDVDTLFTSIAGTIISNPQFSSGQAVRVAEKLTERVNAHWVGKGVGQDENKIRLVLFFDDYETFQAESTKEQRSIFLDSLNHIHMLLPELRVVIASSDYCLMPDVWFYMRECLNFQPENAYFRQY